MPAAVHDPPPGQRLRVAAHVLCFDPAGDPSCPGEPRDRDGAGRLLLAHWLGVERALWTTPGGGLDVGEHPAHAAVREVAEETGYDIVLDEIVGVFSQHFIGHQGVDWHAVPVVYRGHVVGGALRFEQGGSTDRAAWVPLADVERLETVPLVRAALAMGAGRPVRPAEPLTVTPYPPPDPGGGGALAVTCVVPDARVGGPYHGLVPHGHDPAVYAVELARPRGEWGPMGVTAALVDARSEWRDGADGSSIDDWVVRLTYEVGAPPTETRRATLGP